MLVEVLLETEIHVHYGFLTFCSAQTQADEESLQDAWRSQTNGLIGAAVPELLRIRTETHTGQVRVRMELHDSVPDFTDDWLEVVEVNFASWVDDLTLSAFEQFDGPVSLPPGSYRVRYAARTLPNPDDSSVAEECLLQFWPATGADHIVRQTSRSAAHWHRTGTLPPWTAAELSDRVQHLRMNRDSDEDEPAEDPDPEDLPPGWPYHHLLQSLGPAGQAIGYTDSALAAHLTTADPATLRAIACWGVDQALTIAGIRDLPWVDEALAAVRRGDGLPPDLAARHRALARLPALPFGPGQHDDMEQARRTMDKHLALEQLYSAAEPATMETTCSILQATGILSGGSLDWIVAAVRRVFPDLVPTDR